MMQNRQARIDREKSERARMANLSLNSSINYRDHVASSSSGRGGISKTNSIYSSINENDELRRSHYNDRYQPYLKKSKKK